MKDASPIYFPGYTHREIPKHLIVVVFYIVKVYYRLNSESETFGGRASGLLSELTGNVPHGY